MLSLLPRCPTVDWHVSCLPEECVDESHNNRDEVESSTSLTHRRQAPSKLDEEEEEWLLIMKEF